MNDQENESAGREARPMLAYELSLAVAFSTRALPHYCYANVWHAMTECDVLQDAHLVEGWIALESEAQISLIEHCWCECKGLLIVDPSIVLLAGCEMQVCYFPGIRRSRREVLSLACSELPSVHSVGIYESDRMAHTEYRAAYLAAYEHALALASLHHPPKKLIIQPSQFPMAEGIRTTFKIQIVSSEAFLRGSDEPSEV